MATACTPGIETGFVDLGTIQVAVLGVVHGITDILPISSAVHTRLVPTVFGWPAPGAAFSAALHLGVALAIAAYLWRDVWSLGRGAWISVRDGDLRSFEFRTVVGIAIAAVPAAVLWPLVRRQLDPCGAPAREMWMIGGASLAVAAALAVAALARRHSRGFEEIRLRDAIVAGFAQIAALVPGVSRSGATLAAALAMNLKLGDAVRYALLVGLPAMVAIGGKALLDLRKAGIGAQGWELVAVGTFAAAVATVFAVWTLTKVIERLSVWPFVAYRTLMGAFLLLVVWLDVLA